jgi:D-arabinose 1-dehydrogenase-like Zn-dependent alcohol dehydrogenase
MRSVQVSKPKEPLEIVEREIPEPGKSQVRIKVQACGICHGDSITKDGSFPGIGYPRTPGHEIAGLIDKVGTDSIGWKTGERVAVGSHGGHCGHCESCRRGDFVTCHYLQIPGISYDGGYADYMIAPTEALTSIPDELSATEAAPMMCAGITTFNALRNSGARVGDSVAIIGHMAVNGKLIMIGRSDEPLEVSPNFFISGRRSIIGWPSGTPIDSQDTLSFSVLFGVRPMNEIFPIDRTAEAYELMMSGKARFRAVITTEHQ